MGPRKQCNRDIRKKSHYSSVALLPLVCPANSAAKFTLVLVWGRNLICAQTTEALLELVSSTVVWRFNISETAPLTTNFPTSHRVTTRIGLTMRMLLTWVISESASFGESSPCSCACSSSMSAGKIASTWETWRGRRGPINIPPQKSMIQKEMFPLVFVYL